MSRALLKWTQGGEWFNIFNIGILRTRLNKLKFDPLSRFRDGELRGEK